MGFGWTSVARTGLNADATNNLHFIWQDLRGSSNSEFPLHTPLIHPFAHIKRGEHAGY